MDIVIPKDTRIEVKFVAPEVVYPNVLAWLLSRQVMFRKSYPDRWVNNVYFDSYDLQAYEGNLSGISQRIKVRYRWYGLSAAPDVGTLEVKMRRNNFGWKKHFIVEQAPYFDNARWDDIRNLISEQVCKEGETWLQENPQPVLINRYHRCYFESNDKAIRATIDCKQAVWDQRYHSRPNFTRRAHSLPRMMVLELKFPREIREQITQFVNTCPIRMSRNSKYVNGVRSLYHY